MYSTRTEHSGDRCARCHCRFKRRVTHSRTRRQSAATAQPKSGGTLRWSLLGDPATLDGHFASGAGLVSNVFDRLIVIDERLNWVPRLAESWDINSEFQQGQ
jgi:ABC-type transport system substrate-binding protein